MYVDLEDEPNRLDLSDIEAKYRQRGNARPHHQSPDGRLLVVVVVPRGSAGDVAHARRIDGELAALVAATPPPAGLSATVGGTVRSRLAELDAINRDVGTGAWVVAISIGLLLTVYFRHPFAVLPLFAPVAVSLAWTFGITYLVVGTLNLVTAFLVAVLTGLGVEIGIHILVRFQSERRRGGDVEEVLTASMLHAGRPALLAALSSAASFAALMLVEFRGFSDFGLIAAVGLVCASVAYAVLFPAMLSYLHDWGWMRPRAAAPEGGGRPLPRPGAIVAVSVLAAAAAAWFAPRAAFEHDLRNIRSRLPEVRAFNAKVREVFSGARDPAAIVVRDAADVPAVVAAVRARRDAANEASSSDDASPIAEVRWLGDLVPRDVDAKLQLVAGLRARVEQVRGRVSAEEAARIDEVLPSLDPRPIRGPADLPASLRRPFEGVDGGGGGQLVLVYQKGSLLDLREAVRFARALADLRVGDRVYAAASEPLVYADLYAVLARDAPRAVLLTLAALVIILWLDFRSLRDVALAFVPLALGTLWTVGLMGALDLKLNLLNASVVAVAFGLGIDAGVHVIHHVRELGVERMTAVLRAVAGAVGVCTGVNLLGFGGMLVTDHPGLRSIGTLAIVALVATYAAGIGFFPAALHWLARSRRPAPPSRRG
jgi:uncharacterized membrane protein YdfJ with MMPL/SSD domain